MTATDRTTRRAFTLIELLVVLALITIAVGITVPALDALQRSGRGGAAANSISVAVNAARIYNHRIGHSDLGAAGSPPFPEEATYSGTAALFTPAGEIRLVVNDQAASDRDGDYIDGIQPYNAYKDIPHPTDPNRPGIDYISLPRSARVVGVRYRYDPVTDQHSFEVLPAPFTVRFNEYGHVATDQEYIYYDSKFHGTYDIDDERPTNYNPDAWGRDRRPHPDTGRRELPFDTIEVVSGVIAFNTREFYNFQHTVFAQPGVNDDEYDMVYDLLAEHLPEAYRPPGQRQAIEDYPADEQPIVRAVRRLAENSTPINFSPLTGLSIRASLR